MKLKLIENKINLKLLDKNITSNTEYIIVNSDTLKFLCEQYKVKYDHNDFSVYVSYKGIPIATCEKFDYGEVEII